MVTTLDIASYSLSQSYASASSALQTSILGAEYAALDIAHAIFFLSLILFSLGLIGLGLPMLKGPLGKALGYLTIVAGLIGIGGSLIPSSNTLFAIYYIIYTVWLFWAGYKLYRLR